MRLSKEYMPSSEYLFTHFIDKITMYFILMRIPTKRPPKDGLFS